ncbi:MAG: glycosyltransferase family 39 protein [Deltaproteobacteria bacterium]|nr:glycosyltransferase family 39 protein [Deltaproteobacteria bacterium]
MQRRHLALGAGVLALCFVLKAPSLGLPLFNMDDWGGLRDGLTLLFAGPEIVADIFLGRMGPRGARPVPSIVWSLGWLLFGGWDGGYYLLDLLIHLAGGAALFAILLRWTGPVGAAVGLAVYAFDGRVHQVGYLGALDDNLVTSLCLGALALWPRARGSGVWASVCAALVLFALLTKSTAIVLPAALLGLDLVDGRQTLTDRRDALRRYGAVGVAGLLFGVHLWGLLAHPELARGHRLPFVAQLQVMGTALVTNIGAPVASRSFGGLAAGLDLLRWLPLAFAAILAWRVRRPSVAVMAFGAAWLLASAWLPMRFLLALGNGRLEDRHTLMPAVGVAIVLAGLVGVRSVASRGRAPTLLTQVAAAFVALSALSFALWDTPILASWERSAAPALEEGLRDAVLAMPEGEDIHLGLVRMEHGTLGMLDFWILSRLVPGLAREPRLFLVGAEIAAGDFEGAQPRVTQGFSLDEHVQWSQGEAVLVEEVRAREGTSRFRLVQRDDLTPLGTGARPVRWGFPTDAEGWSQQRIELGLPDDEELEEDDELDEELTPRPAKANAGGLAIRVPRDDRMGAAGVVHAMSRPPWTTPPALVGPGVELSGRDYCEIVVDQTVSAAPGGQPPRPRRGDFISPGCGGVLFFSESGAFDDEVAGIVHLPGRCGGGRQRLVGRLDNSPHWRGAEVRALGLVPAREWADVTVHSVELRPCGE